ncbi:MAG: hypothetical protein JRI68_20675, partial [Deltaproteobacteria bacterium]|nr:hypothetical protein [Deltaproteobacteria bacterium]
MSQRNLMQVGLLSATVWLSLALVLSVAGCGASDNANTGSSTSSNGTGGVGGFLPGGAGGVGGGSGGSECTDEVCDGLDNDCDNEVDEGCQCTDGETQTCYSGDPNLIDIGECAEGLQTCDLAGDWGSCDDEVLPIAELCDSLDNDCDEQVDEDFGSVTCGLGICQVTVDECMDGVPNPCLPGQPNPSETCDGSDDDCDGQVDEGCTCVNGTSQSCYTGSPLTQNVGECTDGIQTCTNGQYGNCVGDVTPVTETCNGLDDDCDNQADENDPDGGGTCTTGLDGVCSPGVEHCVSGQLQCQQNVQPSSETCNGQDDDCDGATDENNPGGGGACNTGLLGVCMPGLFVCQNGGLQCTQTTQPSTEICNGDDDDCDGSTDENNPGGGGACSTGLNGICDAGTYQCQSGNLNCVQTATAGPETCNGQDDDCDGATDEGNPGGGGGCNTGLLGVCAAGTDICQGGTIQCVQNVQSSSETCNGDDDDCDGATDENNPGGGAVCNTGLLGVCAPGTTQCQNGTLDCAQNVASGSETCNGDDDDCDGATDENNPGGGVSCNTGLLGVCAAGTTQCQNGTLDCSQNVASGSETCNGDDDDCDGATDENNPGGGAGCTVSGQQGECANGTLTCLSGSLQCPQSVFPTSEVCTNGLDEDCNGTADDGCGCAPGNVTTTYVSNNGKSGNMFDVVAVNNINVLSFDGNFNAGTHTVEIYYKVGTHVGSEANAGAWTLIGSTSLTSNGADVATPLPIPMSVSLPAGQTYAFYITTTVSGINYTGGTTLGSV